MGTKLAGLLCLITALGVVFYLWSQTLKARSKHQEDERPNHDADSMNAPERRSDLGVYSLLPTQPIGSPGAPCDPGATEPATALPPKEMPEFPEIGVAEVEDELAKTHLEIARQFFQMGDFEGTFDMTNLVIENGKASTRQINAARQLQSECA